MTGWPIPRTPTCSFEKDDEDAPKPVARHFNLPNDSKPNMSISLQQGTTESSKNLKQKFIFQISILNLRGINERLSMNWFILVFHVTMFPPIA